jgi:hypothetical protein
MPAAGNAATLAVRPGNRSVGETRTGTSQGLASLGRGKPIPGSLKTLEYRERNPEREPLLKCLRG